LKPRKSTLLTSATDRASRHEDDPGWNTPPPAQLIRNKTRALLLAAGWQRPCLLLKPAKLSTSSTRTHERGFIVGHAVVYSDRGLILDVPSCSDGERFSKAGYVMHGSFVRRIGIVGLVLGTVSSAACASRSINQVLADPSRYTNKQVTVSGSVVDSYAVVGRGAYQLEDKTGRLWIVSDKGVPRKGARVSVKGTVREGFSLGGFGDVLKLPPSIGSGLVLMESSHKAK
jgi:hypothetical protein